MRGALAVLLTLPVLAGCLGATQPIEPAATDALSIVAHQGDLLRPIPAPFAGLATRIAPTGFLRGEPTLGITSGGVIFTVAGAGMQTPALPSPGQTPLPVPGPNNRVASVARSADHGRTWEQLWDPAMMGKIDLDPWVWVDPATDRVFHAPLYVACSHIAWSDDLGDSWMSSPLGGCGTPAHDHQKLTTGPAPEGVATQGYPSVAYYSYNSFRGEGTVITTSWDGGITWLRENTVHPQDDCAAGIAGPVDVAPDGTAYSPKPTCDGVSVAVSKDGGQTWGAPVAVAGIAAPPHGVYNPHVALDTEGNAYLVSLGADGLPWMSTSRDQGATWSAPVRVTPPGLRSAAFVAIIAGAPGRVALAAIATDSDPATWPSEDPSEARDDAVWHAYLTFTDDALAAQPTFVTQRITPLDDPVQVGCIWLRGGGEPCRNLRDFIDLQQHEGRPYLVYADGCDRCTTADESRRLGETTVAIVEGGPSLLGGTLEARV